MGAQLSTGKGGTPAPFWGGSEGVGGQGPTNFPTPSLNTGDAFGQLGNAANQAMGFLMPPAPQRPDFTGAAETQGQSGQQGINQQTQANRPNISTPFANQQWAQGPDGQWSMQAGFSGPMAGMANSLQGQATNAMSAPMDWGKLGTFGTGDDARKQAIDAAYSQASSRLNPQWQQREDSERTRLLNQGLSEGSEAYKAAMGDLGRERNDAYGGAMNSAIGMGTAAGDSAFHNNLMAYQQRLADAIRQREMPMGELQQMQGFLSMPGFQAAGAAQPTQYLPAAMAQGNYDMGAWQGQNQNMADIVGGGSQLAGSLLPLLLLSDERAKQDIVRHKMEVLPGVPLASYRYRPEHDASGRRYLGVIAQDLARVAPQYVRIRPDGLLEVDYSFLNEVPQ